MTGAVGKPEVEETAWTMPRRSMATIAAATLGLLMVAALPAAIDWSALNRPLWQTDATPGAPTTEPVTTTGRFVSAAGAPTTAPERMTTTVRRATSTTGRADSASGTGTGSGSASDPLAPSRSQTPSASGSDSGGSGPAGSAANWLALLLPLLLLLVAGSLGIRSAMRSRPGRGRQPTAPAAPAPPDPDGIFSPRPDFSAQISAIDQLLWEIEQERDPRLAIQRVYAAVETGLGNPEMRRRDQETPGVYLRRVLGDLGSLDNPLAELTRLFELARFSIHPISEAMRTRAVELLLTIRAGYANASGRPGVGAAATTAPVPGRRPGPGDDRIDDAGVDRIEGRP